MKRSIFLALVLLFSLSGTGQNLVPNSSFESYSMLPDLWGQWSYCNDWTNAGGFPVGGFYGDPDYFHSNGTGPVALPNTSPAYVTTHTGDAIMGFLGYHDPNPGTDVREYLMVRLDSALTVGKSYHISFWITNGFSSIGHYYSCDGIGLHFSTNALNQNGNSYIDRSPQLEIAGEVWETSWVQKSFSFNADSAYEYLTIGNFYPDSATNTTVQVSGPAPFAGAYYFIDDVSVTLSPPKGLEDEIYSPVSVGPNPFRNKLSISLDEYPVSGAEFRIYSPDGKLHMQGRLEAETELETQELASGIYLLELCGEGFHQTRCLVKE